jgi:hypothetical protein
MSFRPTAIFRTHRRFVVPEPPEDFRDRYIAALNDNAFCDPLTEIHKEERIGWVDVAKPLRTGFSDINRWLFNQYATFALRVDQKRIQPAKLAALLEERCGSWCRANQRERCPSKVKAEIKEQVEAELLQKTTAKMQTYGVVWNVAEGWLVIACTSTTRLDTFRKLFHRTFGMALVPADPLDMVPAELGCVLLDVGATDFQPDNGIEVRDLAPDTMPDGVLRDVAGDDEVEGCPPHIPCEFYLWLWWRAREGRGSIDLPEGKVEWWLDGRIDFRAPGEDKTVYSVGGDDPSASAVAMAALAHGGILKGIGLALRRDDREYTVRLGAGLTQSALKLPSLVKGGDNAEQLYEAAFLFEEQSFLLRCLFAIWAQQRVAQGMQGQSAIRRWLGLELAAKFEADANGQGLLFGRAA